MFQDALIKLDKRECETLLEEVGPHLQGKTFTPGTVTILGQELSFYPGYRFLDIADYDSIPAARRFVIHKPGAVTVLNWSNEPIYQLNQAAPIRLDENNVADYVRFFFSYIRGQDGRFIISENIDDIMWREEPPPAARQAIGKILKPVSLSAVDEDGTFVLELCMMYKDSLFQTGVRVSNDGTVSLHDEELLIEDMPVLDDTFGQ